MSSEGAEQNEQLDAAQPDANQTEAKKGLQMMELLSGRFIESKVTEIVNEKLGDMQEKVDEQQKANEEMGDSVEFLAQFFNLEGLQARGEQKAEDYIRSLARDTCAAALQETGKEFNSSPYSD